MIVDPRAGSSELIEPLQRRDHDVVVKRLPYGDVKFTGSGPEGRPVQIGVEVKKIGDFLSSVYSGRLVDHQLPGMLDHYDYSFILLQGRIKCGSEGELLIAHKYAGWVEPAGGRTKYYALSKMLLSLSLLAGLHILRAEDTEDSADVLTALALWWKSGWDSHSTLKTVKYFESPSMRLSKPSILRRVAAQLPGVGYKRSAVVADHPVFLKAMAAASRAASEGEWATIPGIGKIGAKRIRESLR